MHPRKSILLIPAVIAAAVFMLMAAPAMAVSPDEPVTGISPATPAQLEAELSSRNPGHIHPGIAQLYVDWGYRFGIRSDVAFAQMLHETNFLRYGGDVQPWQNNFAGIGATGGGNPGNSFANAEAGVIAHYAHLAWYVYPNHRNEYCNSTWDPRHFGTTHRYTVFRIRDLGGQWAVPGNGYGEALARYATEIWNYTAQGHWAGSFNEVPGFPDNLLSTSWFFPWYDSMPAHGMGGNWLLISNRGTGEARVRLTIGPYVLRNPADPDNDFWTIPEDGQIAPSFGNFMSGPISVTSLDGQPLFASQRVIYRDSFNEVPGIPAEGLVSSWEFTWYDSLPEHGMGGNWILIANMGSQPADVEVLIGGQVAARYQASSGNAIAQGAIVTPSFPLTMNGPVIVRSTNGQPLIASQRVIFKETFNELMGSPTTLLGNDYHFTWYDSNPANGMGGDWVLIANRGTQAADVDVYVGNDLVARYNGSNAIPTGGMATPSFANLTDGPVRVVSTNAQSLLVSQRVVYKDSFEEVQGVPSAGLAPEQVFSWYDSSLVNYMLNNWVLIANMGTGEATVEIRIGGVKMNDPENPGNDFFTVPENGIITPSFNNYMGGPVEITATSGQPLMVSQRVLYKDGLAR